MAQAMLEVLNAVDCKEQGRLGRDCRVSSMYRIDCGCHCYL